MSNKLCTVHLGKEKIKNAYFQFTRPIYDAYDYRVEWIQTDGVASYIDTGIVPKYTVDGTSKISITFNFPEMPSGNQGPCVCGERHGTSGVACAFVITIQDMSTNDKIIVKTPNLITNSPLKPRDTYIHTIEMAMPDIFVDGISYASGSSASDINCGKFMIGCSGDPSLWALDRTTWHASKVRIYHCKIITDGVTVFDAFPVVKNGQAGLYDRVSGKVCFNANTTGTITAGPQVPFDNEVEWIQRDVRYIWEQGGSSVTGGYNLAEYIPSGATTQNMPQYWLEGSCANTNQGPAHLTMYGANIFNAISIWKPANRNIYAFGTGNTSYTTTTAELDVFHRFAWKGTGTGTYDMYIDGSLFGSRQFSGSASVIKFLLLYTTLTGDRPTTDIKFRIKRFRFGNTVDMIPVVKDDKMGFYNRVDGKVFLEKQPCLSAGPAIQ